jgi:hypothetical protein
LGKSVSGKNPEMPVFAHDAKSTTGVARISAKWARTIQVATARHSPRGVATRSISLCIGLIQFCYAPRKTPNCCTRPEELTATLFHALGIAQDAEIGDPLGGPHLVSQGTVIRKVF